MSRWPRDWQTHRTARWLRWGAIATGMMALAVGFVLGGRGPVHLLVLLDDSASMPRPSVDEAWSALAPRLVQLPRGSRLSIIRIGARPSVEIQGQVLDRSATASGLDRPLRRLRLNDAASAIAAALGQALALLGPGETGIMLLISDGRETLGRAEPVLQQLAAARIPVLWWDPTRGRSAPDAAVRSLTVQVGPAGETIALVELVATDRLAGDLVVELDNRALPRRTIALAPDQPLELELRLGELSPGPHRVTAMLQVPGDLLPGNDRRGTALRVPGPPRVGLVARTPGQSQVAHSLAAGGWAVEVSDGGGFDPRRLAALGVLILEGITPADLSETAWTAIEGAVTQGRSGLILLGGPGTFGAGGYRHSTLEGLLPVTAQAPERTPAATVIFAVDKSGSMAQPTALGTTRLGLAQAAVAAAARSLGPKDQSAVLGFDVQSHLLVPLAAPGQGARDLGAAWQPSPGGGTRLAPAIEQALDLFPPIDHAPLDHAQRLLVLVSDGQVADPERAAALGDRLAAAGVQLSVLAVGDPAEGGPLQTLADTAGGHFQAVTEVTALPALLEGEVERRRDPIMPGPLRPQVRAALPLTGPTPDTWPEVLAYPVTRAREAAQVYLAAPNGDPLLAAHRALGGRVVALPAGLDAWAPDWPAWPHWGNFLGGLVAWAAGDGQPLGARMQLQGDGRTRLQIDREDGFGRWSPAAPLDLVIQDPDGRREQVQARPVAPGRLAVDLDDAPAGHYRILTVSDQADAADLWYQSDLEFQPGGSLEPAATAGLLVPWSAAAGALPLPRLTDQPPRTLVLGALLLFLAGMLTERLPFAGIGPRPWRRPPTPTPHAPEH